VERRAMDDLGPVQRWRSESAERVGGERWRLHGPITSRSWPITPGPRRGSPSRSEGQPAIAGIRHSSVQSVERDRAHPATDRTILTWLHRTRFACHAHRHRILHRLKLRAPGRQVGGRARATVPRRDGGSPTGNGWTIRSLEGRFADLPKVEARPTCGGGRDRELVARGSLSSSGSKSGPMRRLDALARGTSHPT
jgi:hypothetical protein